MKDQPYWWDTLPPAERQHLKQTTETSGLPARADVVIVGAGYTGLSAARQLARAGASVLVVEREQIGWGASSRNGGHVLTGLKLEAATLVAKFGEARARQLFDIASDSITELEALITQESIDCEYERSGHVRAAWKPGHFDGFREEQALLARVFKHEVHLVPRGEQRREVGSDRYHGLLVDERSGALNPAQYVRGLAAAAIRAGATIASGAGVTSVQHQAGGCRVQTSRGPVDARDVLFATNGYTDAASPALQRRFVPIGSYIIATEPLDESQADSLLPKRRMAFDSKHFPYYFRLTTDRRLLFGGKGRGMGMEMGRAAFGRSTPDTPPDTTRRAAAILRNGMLSIFPGLAAVRIDYAWGGNMAFTRDQMPRAGRLDDVYYAGGYCGHGVAMATYLGALIARRIAGEPIDHPLIDDRFPAIPMYSGDPWFLPLVGAYYQVKDWLP